MSAINLRALKYARDVCEDTPHLSFGARFLLVVLATYADQAGVCWPSIPTLARVMGVTDRNVRKARAQLVDAGAIAVDQRPGHSAIVRFPVVADYLRAVPAGPRAATG